VKIGIISDIHEDVENLKSTIALLSRKNCDEIFCLGDIVGFCLPFNKYISKRDANECIDIVKSNCSLSVIGNHDLYAIRKIPQHKFDFNYVENWYSLDYESRQKLSRRKIWLYEDNELPIRLTQQNKSFLSELNEFEIIEVQGDRILFSHFVFPDLTGSSTHFPKNAKDLKEHFRFMTENKCVYSFTGHGHVEGLISSDEMKMKYYKFEKLPLKKERRWIVGPCVARTTRKNGVMILNTDSLEIESIPITN